MNANKQKCTHPAPIEVGQTYEGPGHILVSWCPDCGALKREMTNWKCTYYGWRLPGRGRT